MKAVIEIPAGSLHKYEIKGGCLTLDRPLNQPIPHNYGFVPGTLCEDGDALDIFVLTDTPIYPNTVVNVDIIGVIKCVDNGEQDDKLVGTLVGDCLGYETMGTAIIHNYLETYKEGFKVVEAGGKDEAMAIYDKSVELYTKDLKIQALRMVLT